MMKIILNQFVVKVIYFYKKLYEGDKMNNSMVKNIIKKIKSDKSDCCLEVLSLDNDIILFANKGSIEDVKESINKELVPFDHILQIINIATAKVIHK